MNWIDALLALIIILALWTGWQRGFINGALGLFTWAVSFTAGYFLYPLAATFIEHFTSALGIWVQAVAFIGTVIIARIFWICLRAF